jgi:hypothetical protein
MTKIPHSVYSPYLSPCDLWFFGHAKEQTKDQIITSEDDLKGNFTEVWETVSGDLLFYK